MGFSYQKISLMKTNEQFRFLLLLIEVDYCSILNDDPDDEVHMAVHEVHMADHDRCDHNVPVFSAANGGTQHGVLVGRLGGYHGTDLWNAQEHISY